MQLLRRRLPAARPPAHVAAPARMTRVQAPLDPGWLGILRPLARAGVEHVVLGALAETVYGRPRLGDVLTIAPAGYSRNLARLSAALSELDTGLRVDGESQTLPIDCGWLTRGRVGLGTDEGPLDLVLGRYAELVERSQAHELVPGLIVELAAPEDVWATS